MPSRLAPSSGLAKRARANNWPYMLEAMGSKTPKQSTSAQMPGKANIRPMPIVLHSVVPMAITRLWPNWSPKIPRTTEETTAITEAKASISEKAGLLIPNRSIAISDW